MKIRLGDADRERYGAPDELDCSLDSGLSVREAIALERATGKASPDLLAEMLPKAEPHPTDDSMIRYRYTPGGMRLLVWLGLHRADIDVPFDDLNFNFTGFMAWHSAERPGKAVSSRTSEPATASKSRRSGRSTRSKT